MKIYITNLGDQVTEESLTATFSTYGKVISANLEKQDVANDTKGFALIDMPDALEAAIAISQIDGSIINGHAILVQEAV